MGIDYSSVAGYGVKLDGNLNKKGESLFDEMDDYCPDHVDFDFNDLEYDSIGNYLSGEVEYVFIFEDPLNNVEEYKEFKDKINDLDIFIDCEPKWINEICIS